MAWFQYFLSPFFLLFCHIILAHYAAAATPMWCIKLPFPFLFRFQTWNINEYVVFPLRRLFHVGWKLRFNTTNNCWSITLLRTNIGAYERAMWCKWKLWKLFVVRWRRQRSENVGAIIHTRLTATAIITRQWWWWYGEKKREMRRNRNWIKFFRLIYLIVKTIFALLRLKRGNYIIIIIAA